MQNGFTLNNLKHKNMTPIAPELKLTTDPTNVKGIMLGEPTKVSHIVIQAIWDLEKIKSNFILITTYTNNENGKIMIRYSKQSFDKPIMTMFLDEHASNDNKNFICNHIGFSFTFPTNIPHDEINEIKILIKKFDDDNERESYLVRSPGSGDLPEHKDRLLL